MHVLFFIELNTRRVYIAGITGDACNIQWTSSVARQCASGRTARRVPIETLIHDRDQNFGPVFDEVFESEGITIKRTPWRAPRANAYAERSVRTVRRDRVASGKIVRLDRLGGLIHEYEQRAA